MQTRTVFAQTARVIVGKQKEKKLRFRSKKIYI